jgi:NADH-quinone oxidoreductase subunit L
MTGHWFIDHLWLVPLFPFLGFLLVGLVIRPLGDRPSSTVAILAMVASAVVGWGAAFQYFTWHAGETLVPWQYEWLRFSPTLVGNMGVLVDDISMLLVLVVTTISLLIHVYSQGYMRGDPGYPRFFSFLNLFTFSMLGLVLACSVLQMFIFWELVGVSSFLLIGFYWAKPSAVSACKKAFIVTRFADLGFLLGLLMLSYYAKGLDFTFLTSPETVAKLAQTTLPFLGVSALPLSAILIFCGAAGKSAMFPLHIWLPDAMEGPTPVSALIHAATMVVAGVYLVARMFPMFAASEPAILTVMSIGAFTALFAAVIAVTQFDIKRVLAYSTLSQLGYMMLALGVATLDKPLGFTASMFHLTTHACFKALLFLGAGSVIHAVHTNDMREMGGLRRKLPITHATFLVACLAIAGVPPLSGFFSKDEILAAAVENGHYFVFALALGVAGLTAFYMFRLYFMTFWSEPQDHEKYHHAHESPWSMTSVLIVLAVPTALLGLVPFGHYVHRGELEHHGINWLIAGPAILVGLAGIAVAFMLYFRPNGLPGRIAFAFAGVYGVIRNKFYIDELYLFVTHHVVFRYVSAPFNWFDRHCVDGLMDLTAQSALLSGRSLRRTVTGHLQTYLLWALLGSAVLALVIWQMQAALGWALTLVGLGIIAGIFVWQLVLQLLNRSEPLKRIEKD